MRCKGCDVKLPENANYCPNCGRKVSGFREDEFYDDLEKKESRGGGVLPVIAGILLVLALVIGAVGITYSHFQAKLKEAEKESEQGKEKEALIDEVIEMQPSDEEEVASADINALLNPRCSLVGRVKVGENGVYIISWEDGLTIYGENQSGEKLLLKNVMNVYIDDQYLENDLLHALPANMTVIAVGDLYFRGRNAYIAPSAMLDSEGAQLTVKRKDPKEIEQEEDEDEEKSAKKKKKSGSSDGYVIAASSERELVKSDVKGLSAQEVNYAKNEIYARHGRRFNSQELQEYFDSKSWYKGTISPESFDDSVLTEVERKNVFFLNSVEQGLSSGGYDLDN